MEPSFLWRCNEVAAEYDACEPYRSDTPRRLLYFLAGSLDVALSSVVAITSQRMGSG